MTIYNIKREKIRGYYLNKSFSTKRKNTYNESLLFDCGTMSRLEAKASSPALEQRSLILHFFLLSIFSSHPTASVKKRTRLLSFIFSVPFFNLWPRACISRLITSAPLRKNKSFFFAICEVTAMFFWRLIDFQLQRTIICFPAVTFPITPSRPQPRPRPHQPPLLSQLCSQQPAAGWSSCLGWNRLSVLTKWGEVKSQ